MFEKNNYELLNGNALSVLKNLPDNSVRTCITSPPYYGLRDYGTGHWEGGDPNCPHYRTNKVSKNTATGHKAMMESGNAVGDAIYKSICPLCGAIRIDEQVGLEETPDEYINRLVEIFHEVKRVLTDDGTLWVNIGDSYATNTPNNRNFIDESGRGGNNPNLGKRNVLSDDVKQKDLIGIPWMLAFALRKDGWYLRQDIIWSKTNPMPESVKDRCTKSHEYIFLLSKNPNYYFNHEAIQEKSEYAEKDNRAVTGATIGVKESEGIYALNRSGVYQKNGKRNKRDVWNVAVNTFKGAHFATFPEELILPCILAGSEENDIVLDPFNGSGTTGIVSMKNGRKYIGIDLNNDYLKMAEKRFEELNDISEIVFEDNTVIKVKKVSLF